MPGHDGGRMSRSIAMILMVAGTICFFAVNHILSVAIPLLINDMGMPLSIVGQCTAAMGAVTIIMKAVTPALIRSIRLRLLILLDLAALAAITLAFALPGTAAPVSLTLLRALFGAPFSVFPIVNLIAIARTALNEDDMIRNTSLIGMAMPVSMLLSPAITEFLLKEFSYEAVFNTALASSILCLVLYMLGLSMLSSSSGDAGRIEGRPDAGRRIRIDDLRPVIVPITAFFFLGIADMLLITYFPLIAEAEGKPYSFFFALFSISMVASQKAYSRLRSCSRMKLLAGYASLAISALLAGLSGISFYAFSAISAITFGIGYSLTETTTNTLVMAGNNPAAIVTIQQLSICLGRTFGPWIISFFSGDAGQLKICFIAMAASMLLPLLLISRGKRGRT